MPSQDTAVPVSPRDVAAAQPRVGKTPQARLHWAIEFAQRDLSRMSAGDWANLQAELTAFSTILITEALFRNPFLRYNLEHPQRFQYGNEVYAQEQVREVQEEFKGAIDELVANGCVDLGRFEVNMWIERSLGGRRPKSKARGPLKTIFPAGTKRAIYVFGHLLHEYPNFVKECLAPALRGREGQRCSRRFLAKRLTQVYCSARCQNRVSTRKAREELAARTHQGRRKKRGRDL